MLLFFRTTTSSSNSMFSQSSVNSLYHHYQCALNLFGRACVIQYPNIIQPDAIDQATSAVADYHIRRSKSLDQKYTLILRCPSRVLQSRERSFKQYPNFRRNQSGIQKQFSNTLNISGDFTQLKAFLTYRIRSSAIHRQQRLCVSVSLLKPLLNCINCEPPYPKTILFW